MNTAARLALFLLLLAGLAFSALAQNFSPLVHGLWVWKSAAVLSAPGAAEALLDSCKLQNTNEVYVSISERSEPSEEQQLVQLISLLHQSDIRVEALISSIDADEPGKPSGVTQIRPYKVT